MLQHSLRGEMAAIVVAAVMIWALFVLPGSIGMTLILAAILVAGGGLLAGSLYLHGCRRAFCIGALPLHTLLLLQAAVLFSWEMGSWRHDWQDNGLEIKIYLLAWLAVVLLSGGLSASVRYLALRPACALRTKPNPYGDGDADVTQTTTAQTLPDAWPWRQADSTLAAPGPE